MEGWYDEINELVDGKSEGIIEGPNMLGASVTTEVGK
jgi:hypothetical protein